MDKDRNYKYVIVNFCGDGGQACSEGSRTWSNTPSERLQAARFVVLKREERGHSCGRKSVGVGYSNEHIPDSGF